MRVAVGRGEKRRKTEIRPRFSASHLRVEALIEQPTESRNNAALFSRKRRCGHHKGRIARAQPGKFATRGGACIAVGSRRFAVQLFLAQPKAARVLRADECNARVQTRKTVQPLCRRRPETSRGRDKKFPGSTRGRSYCVASCSGSA